MRKGKVVLGMSGGMDSSAAAAILVKEGYDVHGVTLKVWHEDDNPDRRWQERSCCKIGLARYAADRLGIRHEVIDHREAFRQSVVENFITGYLNGQTPNPCVRCNERIKFGALIEAADRLGADFIATGHYARLERDERGNYFLKEAVDKGKDQSYFLYRLRSEILPRLLFPLGFRLKKNLTPWIESLDLPPDELRESQEICFVTRGDYREFLKQESPGASRPGEFVSAAGDVLGKHEGIAFYTVGQRRGLGISSTVPGERLYVIQVDPSAERVTVGTEQDLYCDRLTVNDINWAGWRYPSEPVRVGIRYRYRGPKIQGWLEPCGDGRISVAFDQPQKAISPGQSAVFYLEERVLGGGIIESFGRTPASVGDASKDLAG